jgi:hypothetical protein
MEKEYIFCQFLAIGSGSSILDTDPGDPNQSLRADPDPDLEHCYSVIRDFDGLCFF